MSIAATINGVTVPAGVLKPDFSLTWRLGGRGTGDVVLIDPATVPAAGQSIAFFEDGVRVWSGAVDSVEASFLGDKTTGMMQYRLTLVSKEQRLSYRLVKPATTTADPSSTYVALSGTVNVGGTSVIWVSGDKFDRNLEKTKIHIGGSDYFVNSVSDSEHLTLTTSAGSGTGTVFSWTPYAGNIVRSLRHHWLQGEAISEGTIEDGDDVGKQVYDHAAVADIYTQLADGSDSIWYVNPEDELCFHARNTVTAGTALDEDNVLDNDPPTATETREDLCNARYQRISYNALDPDSAAIEGDGTAKDFWIDAPISVITAGSIQIGGTFYTCEFGLRGVDSGKDFYYSPGENKLTQEPSYSGTVIDATNASPIEIQTSAPHLLASGHLVFIDNIVGNTGANGQFWRINVTDTDKFEVIDSNGNGAYTSGGTVEANQPLDPGDWLRFNYRRLGSDVINYEDATAISARATVEGTSGRYERLEETTDSVDAAGALSLATAVVDAKKYTSTQARFSTLEKGYQPGQLVDVTVADFGFSADPFLIEEITARDQEDGTFRYTLSLVDGRALGGWRKVFEGLRGTAKGSSLSFVTGGSVVGSGSSTGGGGGSSLAAPADDVTSLTAAQRYVWRTSGWVRQIHVSCLRPSPVGTFEGIHVFREEPDQSSTAQLVADGSASWNGSNALGETGWTAISCARVPYATGDVVIIDNLPPLSESLSVRIYAASYNTDGIENSLVRNGRTGATPSCVVACGPPSAESENGTGGTEYAPVITNPAAFAVYGYNADGAEIWGFQGSWSDPIGDTSNYGGVKIRAYNQANGDTVELVSAGPGDGEFATDKWPLEEDITWDIRFLSRDKDNNVNTYVYGVTPEIRGILIASQGGKLKLTRADTDTFNSDEFTIDPIDGFTVDEVAAGKVFVGSVLRVGGGNLTTTAPSFKGSNGQVAVYNASNQLRAWMGQNGSVYGGWFGELYIGGTGPTDAPLYSNNSGVCIIGGVATGTPYISLRNASNVEVGRMGANINGSSLQGAWFQSLLIAPTLSSTSPRIQLSGSSLAIEGGTLKLNLNGVTTTINNSALLGSFAGIKVETNSSPVSASVMTAGGVFAMYNSNAMAYLAGTAGYGEAHFNNAAGTQTVLVDGSSGSISLSGSGGTISLTPHSSTPTFGINGFQGQTTSFSYAKPGGGSGTVTLIAGIVVSVT